MNPVYVNIPEAFPEMEKAVLAVRIPSSRFISRGSLDFEITHNQATYPVLAGMRSAFRKAFISWYMTDRYQVWARPEAKRRAFTWIVDITGVRA